MLTWILGLVFTVLFLYLASLNALACWHGFIRKEKAPSWVPLLGGVFGVVSLLLVPISGIKHWWVPLFLDWGCLPGIIFTFMILLSRAVRRQ